VARVAPTTLITVAEIEYSFRARSFMNPTAFRHYDAAHAHMIIQSDIFGLASHVSYIYTATDLSSEQLSTPTTTFDILISLYHCQHHTTYRTSHQLHTPFTQPKWIRLRQQFPTSSTEMESTLLLFTRLSTQLSRMNKLPGNNMRMSPQPLTARFTRITTTPLSSPFSTRKFYQKNTHTTWLVSRSVKSTTVTVRTLRSVLQLRLLNLRTLKKLEKHNIHNPSLHLSLVNTSTIVRNLRSTGH
jgi:hypothetical protein